MKPHPKRQVEMLEKLPEAHCPPTVQPSLFSPTILVVDDEQGMRNSLNDLLRMSGYDVTCAANGREAITLLANKRFNLVLLDINMPFISGQGVLDYIGEKKIDTSVIVLSGESTFDQATQALRKGAEDFLTKPFSPDDLLRNLTKILQKRQRRDEYLVIQKRLQGSEELHRFIVNSAPDLIYMLDEGGYFSFVNERVESLLGCQVDDILGRHFLELVFEEDRRKAEYAFQLQRKGQVGDKGIELRLRGKKGDDLRHVEVRALSIELNPVGVYTAGKRGNQGVVCTYGIARDIGDRKQTEALQRYQHYHDFLTSLPNRNLFDDRLDIALGQAKRSGGKLAVMTLDVDRFKKINESFGHLAGDEMLQSVALRLRKCLREGDTLARIGGDEFALLLPNVSSKQDADSIAQKILAISSLPVYHQNTELRITFSIGVALYPDHGEAKDVLLRHADLAMYRVKESGRNDFRYYSKDLRQNVSHTLDIENSLHRAICDNELRLHYQPQFDMATNKVTGLEALIRWQHPQRGLLPPSEFIPVAEETKLICYIGEWVLKQACKDAVVLRNRGLGHVRIAINVSPQQFDMEDFEETLLRTIKQHGLDTRFLEVEITENSIMRDMNKTMEILTALSAAGITIAVDDFGSGYSSLGYLHTLPLHTLKLDRSFVQNIAHAGEKNTIIDAILAMAKGLKIDFIAEGVETQEQHDYLLAAGCSICQGYFYSRPLEFNKLIPFLVSGK
ncbi:MAG: EAL domain-containing protein [Desulfuromonadales bacterium]|nr:EAL domain-containing protein [Desulfuromonadales bacterium]